MADDIDNAVWALRSIETQISVPQPTTQRRVVISGQWPTDLSDTRTPSRVRVAVMDGSAVQFTAQADLSFQGHFSVATENKKSLKIVWYNDTTGEDMTVKVGSWLPSQKVNLKAYGNSPGMRMDRSLIRDVLANRIYDAMCQARAYPDKLKCPEYVWQASMTDNSGMPSGALFGCDGFPAEVWHYLDGSLSFVGLFVWRTTAPNDDFMVSKSTGDDYLVQATYGDNSLWQEYNAGLWGIEAPKSKLYDKTVLTRLIDYFASCQTGAASWGDLAAYGHVPSWVDVLIHTELIYNKDGMVNNIYLACWDKTIWYPYPYDMDESMGIYPWDQGKDTAPDQMGFATDEYQMWKSMRGGLDSLIRKRWADLRTSGAISRNAIWLMVKSLTDLIDPASYAQDVALWGTNDQASVPYILWWLDGRIAWLDQQWGYSG